MQANKIASYLLIDQSYNLDWKGSHATNSFGRGL